MLFVTLEFSCWWKMDRQVYLCKAVIKFLQISNLYALISLPMGPSGLDHFDYGYANTLFWEFAGPWGEWKFKNRFDSIPIRVEQQILSRADVLDPRPAASWNHRTEFMSSQRWITVLQEHFPRQLSGTSHFSGLLHDRPKEQVSHCSACKNDSPCRYLV